MFKWKRTQEYKINIHVLIYYVHITTYNLFNYKRQYILIIQFYRLVQFHIRRNFYASPFFRVSDLGQPVTYARKFCTQNTGHTIYCCMTAGSHSIIYFHIILQFYTRRIFLREPVTYGRKYCPGKTVTFFTTTPTRDSYVIVHFYRLHQVGSFYSCSKQKN